MFAPDQQAVADELLRVCRPGGTIGMANFTPDGLAADFFGVLAPYLPPPPPDAPSPLLWGDEAHVRELFGDRVSSLKANERELVETVPGPPVEYGEFYRQTFGPVIAAFASVENDPERSATLEREFLDFVERGNAGPSDGPTELPLRVPVGPGAQAVSAHAGYEPQRLLPPQIRGHPRASQRGPDPKRSSPCKGSRIGEPVIDVARENRVRGGQGELISC